ncbi:MAG: TonB-dependent receptor, partial [Bacteroidales bacterium]|nr:TonB-dependent receptor [Bacteroidales bacterium]
NLGTTNISYSPELVGASRLTYKPLNGLTFNLINKYVGKQYIDNTSSEERKLDPYFINDFRIDYSFKPKYTNELNLQLLVVNLFNTKYINNAYGGNWYEQGTEYSWIYYYPQAGIHCMLKMQVKF